MSQRHLDDGKADANARGAHGESGSKRDRIGVDALAREVVLGEPYTAETQLLGQRRLFELFKDCLRVVFGRGGMRKREPAKLHASSQQSFFSSRGRDAQTCRIRQPGKERG